MNLFKSAQGAQAAASADNNNTDNISNKIFYEHDGPNGSSKQIWAGVRVAEYQTFLISRLLILLCFISQNEHNWTIYAQLTDAGLRNYEDMPLNSEMYVQLKISTKLFMQIRSLAHEIQTMIPYIFFEFFKCLWIHFSYKLL